MTVLSDIEKLVETTAKQALEKDTSIQSRIDALKVIAPYYGALKKAAGKDPDESDEPTMGDLRRQLDEAEENGHGGSERIQARTRSRN